MTRKGIRSAKFWQGRFDVLSGMMDELEELVVLDAIPSLLGLLA